MKVKEEHEQRLVVLSALLNGRDFSTTVDFERAASLFGVKEDVLRAFFQKQEPALPEKLDPLVFSLVQVLKLPEYSLCTLKGRDEVFELTQLTHLVRAGRLTPEDLRAWAVATLREMKVMKSPDISFIDGVLRIDAENSKHFDTAMTIALNLICYGTVDGDKSLTEPIDMLMQIASSLGSTESEYWANVKRVLKRLCETDMQCSLVNFTCIQMPDLLPFYQKHKRVAWWENSLHTHVILFDKGAPIRVPGREIQSYV